MNFRRFLKPLAWPDAPRIVNAATTPIPGSASSPLQVVASMPYATSAIKTTDGIGRYIGVYVGAVGVEKFRGHVGGGAGDLLEVDIAKGSRVSLRNEETDVITSGTLGLQFMGPQS